MPLLILLLSPCAGVVYEGSINGFRLFGDSRKRRVKFSRVPASTLAAILAGRGAQVQNGSDVLVVVPAISDIGGRVQVSLYFQRDTFPAVLPEGEAV